MFPVIIKVLIVVERHARDPTQDLLKKHPDLILKRRQYFDDEEPEREELKSNGSENNNINGGNAEGENAGILNFGSDEI
jgi:hypothetical protein